MDIRTIVTALPSWKFGGGFTVENGILRATAYVGKSKRQFTIDLRKVAG
jgi:hypothetical protein